jgi:hypothetical protein
VAILHLAILRWLVSAAMLGRDQTSPASGWNQDESFLYFIRGETAGANTFGLTRVRSFRLRRLPRQRHVCFGSTGSAACPSATCYPDLDVTPAKISERPGSSAQVQTIAHPFSIVYSGPVRFHHIRLLSLDCRGRSGYFRVCPFPVYDPNSNSTQTRPVCHNPARQASHPTLYSLTFNKIRQKLALFRISLQTSLPASGSSNGFVPQLAAKPVRDIDKCDATSVSCYFNSIVLAGRKRASRKPDGELSRLSVLGLINYD